LIAEAESRCGVGRKEPEFAERGMEKWCGKILATLIVVLPHECCCVCHNTP
jgi:hypothetical protein